MSLFNVAQNRKPAFLLALIASVLAFVVVGLGAFTRLSHAGLGCPDWPGCYGHVWAPDEGHEVDQANAAYPDMPVQLDKTWPEMVHRYFAGSLVVLTVAILILAIKHRHKPAQPLKLPIFILAFILLQAAFGMWTVTLKLWPQVVTAHLLGGFTMLSLLWLLTLRLNNQGWQINDRDVGKVAGLRLWVVFGLIIAVMQITLGGWTTSNYAALACPDFPTCHKQWLPDVDFAAGFNIFQHVGPNYLGGIMDNTARVAIHFMHRMGALITTVYILVLAARMFAMGLVETRRMGRVLLVVLAVQISLGISNVVFGLPLAIAVAHNLTGAVLLLTFVTLNHRVFTAQPR
ncbi:MAG TPA: COX15/CtaA family protein [Spongiibacteraceae bacterium]|nr:COX15/CtaA family protein [Spongiibacteraceae bacterium]